MIDGNKFGNTLSSHIRKATLDSLEAGRTLKVAVRACTNHSVGCSEPSNLIRVTCPQQPIPPILEEHPSYKRDTIVIGWQKPLAIEGRYMTHHTHDASHTHTYRY